MINEDEKILLGKISNAIELVYEKLDKERRYNLIVDIYNLLVDKSSK